MPKYRKTALIEAEQFLPGEGKIPDGVVKFEGNENSPATYVIVTLEGAHNLRDGDYVCTGAQGERWNVERSIFESTYELAE